MDGFVMIVWAYDAAALTLPDDWGRTEPMATSYATRPRGHASRSWPSYRSLPPISPNSFGRLFVI